MNNPLQPQQPKFSINLSKMPQYTCDCGEVLFVKVHDVRLLPAVISPTGRAMPVLVEIGIKCAACGTMLTMVELQKEAESVINKPNIELAKT
jgi:hypothetical protein